MIILPAPPVALIVVIALVAVTVAVAQVRTTSGRIHVDIVHHHCSLLSETLGLSSSFLQSLHDSLASATDSTFATASDILPRGTHGKTVGSSWGR
jgi:phage-related minor tail protein